MLESPGMLLHMRSHKKDDPLIVQLVKDMQLDNHTHAQMMSTLSRMSGGLQYMGHTSRDWVNREARNRAYLLSILSVIIICSMR